MFQTWSNKTFPEVQTDEPHCPSSRRAEGPLMSLNSPFWKILLRVMVLEDPSLIFQCALKRAVIKAHGFYLTEYYVESVDTVTRRLLKETKNNSFGHPLTLNSHSKKIPRVPNH
jgi:hypothetical protein